MIRKISDELKTGDWILFRDGEAIYEGCIKKISNSREHFQIETIVGSGTALLWKKSSDLIEKTSTPAPKEPVEKPVPPKEPPIELIGDKPKKKSFKPEKKSKKKGGK